MCRRRTITLETLLAGDIFRHFETPIAVVTPANPTQLSALATTCLAHGIAMVRGAGFSYTNGDLHTRSSSITIDTRRLNRILEVNAVEM